MKIIFGAFDNLDIELLSHKKFCHHLLYMLSQISLKVKIVKKNCEKKFENFWLLDEAGVISPL